MDRSRLLTPPPLTRSTLALASVGLVASDIGSMLAGDATFPGGPVDEIAHVLTMLLILWALGPRVTERFGMPALVASVAIDIDHIPDRLGAHWLTAGTPRPYTHSLLTIVVVLLLAACWRRRRVLLLGVALGLGLHFWRDLADPGSGVALLWPFSNHSFSFPHALYLAAMAGVVVAAAWRCRSPGPLGRPVPAQQ